MYQCPAENSWSSPGLDFLAPSLVQSHLAFWSVTRPLREAVRCTESAERKGGLGWTRAGRRPRHPKLILFFPRLLWKIILQNRYFTSNLYIHLLVHIVSILASDIFRQKTDVTVPLARSKWRSERHSSLSRLQVADGPPEFLSLRNQVG